MRERVLVKEPLPIARIDIELVRDASIDNEADVRAPLVDQPLEDDTPALLVMPSVLLVQQAWKPPMRGTALLVSSMSP